MKRLALTVLLCLCAVTAAAKQRNDGYILRLDAERQMARLDLQTFVAVEKSVVAPCSGSSATGGATRSATRRSPG